MSIYAVIDTNILVSSLISRKAESAPRIVIASVSEGRIVPMVNSEILLEYREVLGRTKFGFSSDDISDLMEVFNVRSESYMPETTSSDFRDVDDYIFYATYRMREDSYLVTGNLRHFPEEPRILSPADMVQVLRLCDDCGRILSEPRSDYMSEDKIMRLKKARAAMERMRQSAVASGVSEMTMEEIDEEIRQARAGLICHSG